MAFRFDEDMDVTECEDIDAQNEELSNILKEIFGDEEEVDEREQEENDMFDDEGDNDNADARGFCLWNEAQDDKDSEEQRFIREKKFIVGERPNKDLISSI
uniref:Uncharacterized protein LOC111113648 n=1 Tax=Crassostrea virginica TaxID=6565 RepID=A0A8B8BXR7_CRAVI|nr:uncharacterized protein LOC111113648 [Crassostrea virginica]